jgi:cytochrome c-type biogenesis protein CcmH/NrfF
MLWVVPLALALIGTALVLYLAMRANDEIAPTKRSIDAFGRELRPALLRLRDETDRTRRRVPPDPR